jgi:alanine-synthesizing transaminase
MSQSGVRFSSRTPEDLTPTRLARVRARCEPVPYDLTVSNPTLVGIAYPEDLLAPLAEPAGLTYTPDPRGLPAARAAVAGEYARQGVAVDPDRIVLAASTSEAYSLLFKLLCEPGQAVLAPLPSYPLFEHLARADGLRIVPYQLAAGFGWRLDPDELAAAPVDVRAAVVVHPNNPTGSYLHPDDAAVVAALCAERGWALLADEVFLEYPLAAGPGAEHSFAGERPCLTFSLGGVSKSCGLPQLKVAWIAGSGPGGEVGAALERLEFLADAYLSVATPVQLALPRLLRAAVPVREAIRARCRANLQVLRDAVARHPEVDLLAPEGGWSAMLRFPAVVDEEELAVELLERDGVAVFPGFMFDCASPGYLVLSLLPAHMVFTAGVATLVARIAAHSVG